MRHRNILRLLDDDYKLIPATSYRSETFEHTFDKLLFNFFFLFLLLISAAILQDESTHNVQRD